ncbi:copper-translocating P-type ATPase [Rhodoblastus sphagnicola]|uniref:Copper-translocating P-type ATPase n=2 Tax=Rhodoblastus sphagnicola TaxID=333368 RepID=A0A2S6N673_9HYPH|nr:heavy metal translocating P-type ATPase [Rhodoblastus sphagnicola]PPQ30110.1 copper-translocating P-type ATPase [Rhodoblastus sphagnicola]
MKAMNLHEKTTTRTLEIGGMTCGACVAHVEKVLKAAPGVRDARANLATERAEIDLAPDADLAALARLLEAEDYPPRRQTLEIGVGGMMCGACVAHVEKALKKIPGVLAASANLATHRATVEVLSGAVDYATLAAAIRAEDYEPSPIEAQNHALADRAAEAALLRRNVWLAAAGAAPVVALEMGAHLSPAFASWTHRALGHDTAMVVAAALTTFVLAFPGRRFFQLGFNSLKRGAPDMNALVALGAGAAYLYSLLATFAPNLLPEGARHSYFESAAAIVAFILFGRWLESRARGRAAEAIAGLARLQPKTAHIRRESATRDLPVEEAQIGDLIEIRPGEPIPVDGVVVEGASHVDESLISGESLPVAKKPGEKLVGGAVNQDGFLLMRAEKVGEGTALAGIVRLVESAQGAKLPIQALADKVTAIFVPVVLALSALTFALWMILGPQPALALALVNAVNVLIIACPCAMGLATPAALMTGSGRGAELGILFRRGDALQRLAEIKTLAFDKTGTLTLGKPGLAEIAPASGHAEDDILALAAAVEARSEHPLARALVDAARARGMNLPEVEAFAYQPGLGVSGLVGARKIAVGSAELMAALGADVSNFADVDREQAGRGASVFFIAVDGVTAGLFALADPPRPQAAAAVAALKKLGVATAMLTGDRTATARAIGENVGIDDIRAGLKPEGKVAVLAELSERGPVGFVGDGVNDAPALAAADVGLAMGAGTEIARNSAEVVLVGSNPEKVATAVRLSRAVLRNIKQNLAWAFGYNIVLIPVAMGALYPLNGTLLNPAFGAAAMALSSLFVLGNALRLRAFRG